MMASKRVLAASARSMANLATEAKTTTALQPYEAIPTLPKVKRENG